ncbi:cupin domain-containing protein [Paenibacillus gansuensis]|uniref:Cupin domain-containing protein n=1 Tax=Paenibacillus gansuensis TaxID=306542 RepID=A0ABW5PKP9_9BACL
MYWMPRTYPSPLSLYVVPSYPWYTPFYTPVYHPAYTRYFQNNPLVQQGFFHNAARLESSDGQAVTDYGQKPLVIDIEKVTKQNNTYRTALWTGKHFQVTVMSINIGDDIGLEVHPTTDQFIRIEEGQGLVQMGETKDNLDFEQKAYEDYAIMVPAGKWHNVTNIGNKPLKVYVIYAPPEHPFGTVHETKAAAMAAEGN